MTFTVCALLIHTVSSVETESCGFLRDAAYQQTGIFCKTVCGLLSETRSEVLQDRPVLSLTTLLSAASRRTAVLS